MFAVLVESGDVRELAFALLFCRGGNHNSSGSTEKGVSSQNIGFSCCYCRLASMVIITFVHKAVRATTWGRGVKDTKNKK